MPNLQLRSTPEDTGMLDRRTDASLVVDPRAVLQRVRHAPAWHTSERSERERDLRDLRDK